MTISTDTLSGWRTHLIAWGIALFAVLQANGILIPTEFKGTNLTGPLIDHPTFAVVLAALISAIRAGIAKGATGNAPVAAVKP